MNLMGNLISSGIVGGCAALYVFLGSGSLLVGLLSGLAAYTIVGAFALTYFSFIGIILESFWKEC